MSQEIRKDIESEIGPNGWRLVGKLGAVVLVPTFAGLIWVGAIDNQVDDNDTDLEGLTARVTASETAQATILERTAGIQKQLERLIVRLDGGGR